MIIISCQNCGFAIIPQISRKRDPSDNTVDCEAACPQCKSIYRLTIVELYKGIEIDKSSLSYTYDENDDRILMKDFRAKQQAELDKKKSYEKPQLKVLDPKTTYCIHDKLLSEACNDCMNKSAGLGRQIKK